MALTDAQKRAMQNYNNKNREKIRYNSMKSSSKTFINKYSNIDDLVVLEMLINARKLELNQENKDISCYTNNVTIVNNKIQEKLDKFNEKEQLKKSQKDTIAKSKNKQDRINIMRKFIKENNFNVFEETQHNEIRELYMKTYNIKRTSSYKHLKEYIEEVSQNC